MRADFEKPDPKKTTTSRTITAFKSAKRCATLRPALCEPAPRVVPAWTARAQAQKPFCLQQVCGFELGVSFMEKIISSTNLSKLRRNKSKRRCVLIEDSMSSGL